MKHLEDIPSDVRSPDVSTLRPAREFFYDPLPGHGFHRFCRFCYENPENIPKSLHAWKKPGRELTGCIQYNASPGALQRHLRRMHDVETVVFREENFNGKRDIDEVITLDFTYCFVLRDLLPLRFVAKPGCKKFMGTHIRKKSVAELR